MPRRQSVSGEDELSRLVELGFSEQFVKRLRSAGIKFSVYINNKGRSFELRCRVKSETEIHEVNNKLRSVYGEDLRKR